MASSILEQSFSKLREAIGGDTIGNNENAIMGAPFIIELERQADEVVPIPSHKTAPLRGGAFQLLEIREPFGHGLVNADSIQPPVAEEFCHSLAQVLIQVISQE